MSGIAGLFELRGAPVDARLLRRMTDSMAYRGPDGRAVWTDGPIGLGHASLRTTLEAAGAQQPCSPDGRVWITADARIDDRATLVARLESHGRQVTESADDAQLILHAYIAWGDACVDHLLGDFAFAIWDGAERRLFCARDRFGVKPFYFALVRDCFVFSNTLDTVRLHPLVSDRLNEAAVGDFLLFGCNQDTATTIFVDVQRLAPAHRLSACADAVRSARYWTLPTGGETRYRRPHEYVDHFTDLLRAAVNDRLRAERGGIWMSGGLDSTSIAALTRELMRGGSPIRDFDAFSIVYDRLFLDEERGWAQMAADALGVPIHHFVADDYRPFEGWDSRRLWTPEPMADPFFLALADQIQIAVPRTRFLLCGDGGDEALARSPLSTLWRTMPLSELGAGIVRSLALYRQRPDGGIRSVLRRWFGPSAARLPYPVWLNRAFEERLDLRGRWREVAEPRSPREHALRPEAYRRMTLPLWPACLEIWDPGVTRAPVEPRYPFLDVRLIEYLFSIPPLPWCVNKQIVRESMRGKLPEPVRCRPKVPLAADPLVSHVRKTGSARIDRFVPVPQLALYVDRSTIPPIAGSDGMHASLDVRPFCLNHWLEQLNGPRASKEKHHHELSETPDRQRRQETLRAAAPGRVR